MRTCALCITDHCGKTALQFIGENRKKRKKLDKWGVSRPADISQVTSPLGE